MKTYNRETDPTIIEIEKVYIENFPNHTVDSIGEENNINNESRIASIEKRNTENTFINWFENNFSYKYQHEKSINSAKL